VPELYTWLFMGLLTSGASMKAVFIGVISSSNTRLDGGTRFTKPSRLSQGTIHSRLKTTLTPCDLFFDKYVASTQCQRLSNYGSRSTSQVSKKLLYSKIILNQLTTWFMKPGGSMSYLQRFLNNPYPEPKQLNSSYWHLFLKDPF
jgi:hypothetical protein